MKEMMDYGLVDGTELAIKDGDFVVVESTQEHQRQLVMNGPGSYKAAPTVGVGAINYVDDESPQAFVRRVAQEFARDGMKNVKVTVNAATGVLDVTGNY